MVERLTIDDVWSKVNKAAEGNFDVVRPFEKLRFNDYDNNWILDGERGESAIAFKTNATCFSEICNFLGIPTAYAEKLPTELFSDQVMHWKNEILRENPDKKMRFRLKETSNGIYGRAMVSDTYNDFDNDDLLKSLEDAIGDSDVYFERAIVNDDRFAVTVMLPELCMDLGINPIDGKVDKFIGGLHFLNSETGLGSVFAKFFLFRQWCRNGATVPIKETGVIKRAHRGKFDELVAHFQDGISAAIKSVPEYMEKFLESRDQFVFAPDFLIDYIAKSNNLTKRLAGVVKETLNVTPKCSFKGYTLWDVINAFTASAKSVELEDKIRLEGVGGSLIGKRIPAKFREDIADLQNMI
jgi:hypothetical protein